MIVMYDAVPASGMRYSQRIYILFSRRSQIQRSVTEPHIITHAVPLMRMSKWNGETRATCCAPW